MGKRLVMQRDTTYTPSAVYGFKWVEETTPPLAYASKIEALMKGPRKSGANVVNLIIRHTPFVKAHNYYAKYRVSMKKRVL